MRRFAEQYGGDVVGVVLVGPTRESSTLFSLNQNRWIRIRDQATGRSVPEPRRLKPGEPPSAGDASVDFWPEEFHLLHLARRNDPATLGSRPLVVVIGTRPERPPGTSDEQWKALSQEKAEQWEDQARLSRNSKILRDPSSGHDIHVENPRLVARAIEEVADAASKGMRLVP